MVDAFVGKIVDLIVDPVINNVKHHGAYVIQYKDKVQQLEQEKQRLCEKKDRIQGMVDRATNKGEVVETEVSSWLKKVEQMEGVITNFLNQPEGAESFRCFLGCTCPNLIWRHKRGMEAENSKLKVSELITIGKDIDKLPVGHSESFQSELQFDSSQYYTTFQSRALVVEQIKNALKDSRVDVIGVHGPGGVGKTTMVTEIAKEAKAIGIFDKFVIAVVSKDLNMSKLQEELASQLDFKYEQKSESGRADELRKALLKGKRKILVILDGLWQELPLNAIGIPTSGLGNRGRKILLTSRDEEVFRKMKVHSCIRIGYLEEQESWKLFTSVTGDLGVDESIAREVSKRCRDLPLAIVTVGAALEGKDDPEWKDALRQLGNSSIKYIERKLPKDYIPLKWSYDFLKEEDAKSCFLLCCLFPEDVEIPIDDLVRYSFALGFLRNVKTLEATRNRVQTMVNMLKRSCLLLNGVNKNFVKMHDLIRDLAISITEEKQIEHEDGHNWPGQQLFKVDHDIQEWWKNDAWEHHTAISLRINKDNNRFPYGVLHCPLMHTLVLEQLGISSPKIPNDFFEGMKEARVLDFKNMFFELPSSILELDHLRMLRLNNCKLLGDLSTIQNLKNHIEILSFEGSTITKLPQEIGKLTCLRSLDLRNCLNLKVIPKGVISDLIHLEELYVGSSFDRWDTTIDGASIAELKSLNQLTVLHVDISTESYKIMAQGFDILFEKLINFAIFLNPSTRLDEWSPNVLEIHRIDNIGDEFLLLMDKVEKLRLSYVRHLKYLRGKPQLQPILSGGGSFCKLTDLHIFACDSMKYLFSPSCAKAFQQLKTLAVDNCGSMEQIIGARDHSCEKEVITNETIIFSRLEKIYLSHLPQLRSFCPKMEKTTIAESIFNEKVSFPILEELTIDSLSVEDIWIKQMIQSSKGLNKVSFSQLRKVNIYRCAKLVNVFPSNVLPQLQNLEILCVKDCRSLTLLVEDPNLNIQSPTVKFKFNDVFPKLRDLTLITLPKLIKIWLNDENYCSNDNSVHLYLKTISIIRCGSLRHVFSAFIARHLACIEQLKVQGCHDMEVIVSKAKGEGVTDDGIIKFCQLKALGLGGLPNLKSFYQSKFEASHFFNQVTFPKIKSLYLRGLKRSREIQLWDFLATTQGYLHLVNIFDCQVSTKVSSHHQKQSFRMIDELHLKYCWGFEHVIDLNGTISIGEEQFVDVKILVLYNLHELVFLWNKNLHKIGGFQSLRSITIGNCFQLRSVFTLSMAMTLQHLEVLSVACCEMMEEIIIIEENDINFAGEEKTTPHIEFPKLKGLILHDLPNLKTFCKDEGGLFSFSFSFSSLRIIDVKGCPKMKTFASGQIGLPSPKIRASARYWRRSRMKMVPYIGEDEEPLPPWRMIVPYIGGDEELLLPWIGDEELLPPRRMMVPDIGRVKELSPPPRVMVPYIGGDEEVEITDLNAFFNLNAFFKFRNEQNNRIQTIIQIGEMTHELVYFE